MSPKAKSRLAREHLERALPAVMSEDYTEAVTWLFAALEAAIAAPAGQHGVSIEPKHWRKAEAAEQLYAEHAVPIDFAPTLRTLNNARKKAVYEGESPTWAISLLRTWPQTSSRLSISRSGAHHERQPG